MKLFEIDEAILNCIDFETGEIIDLEKLEELQMMRDTKIENIALWIKNLAAEAAAIKEQKDIFAEREKATKKKIESLKEYLTLVLKGEKFTSPKVNVSFRKSEAVSIEDEAAFIHWAQATNHDQYLSYSEPTISKSAIKSDLNAGVKINSAKIVTNQNINIK